MLKIIGGILLALEIGLGVALGLNHQGVAYFLSLIIFLGLVIWIGCVYAQK